MIVPKIRNSETIEPGALVRLPNNTVVFRVIETMHTGEYLKGRLRSTRNGEIVSWQYLDEYIRVEEES